MRQTPTDDRINAVRERIAERRRTEKRKERMITGAMAAVFSLIAAYLVVMLILLAGLALWLWRVVL